MDIAHCPCQVPSIAAQRLVLLLHTARGGRKSDYEWAWQRATDQEKAEVHQLAIALGAEVAFAAATGDLDSFKDAPDHDLWALYSTHQESDRWAEWRARWRAARGVRKKLAVASSMMRVNRGHLEMELGHEPSNHEMHWASRRRAKRAVRAALRKLGRR